MLFYHAGEHKKDYNKQIATILMKCSKDKEMETNQESLQSYQTEAPLKVEPPSAHAVDDKPSVDGMFNKIML